MTKSMPQCTYGFLHFHPVTLPQFSLSPILLLHMDLILTGLCFRDELREQHALGEEIAAAITSAPIGEPIDEADLEEELEGLEQEVMDERMLRTGTVPVAVEVDRLPPVKAQEADEEEELRKLQAEMAM